jgi:hypothetical protein
MSRFITALCILLFSLTAAKGAFAGFPEPPVSPKPGELSCTFPGTSDAGQTETIVDATGDNNGNGRTRCTITNVDVLLDGEVIESLELGEDPGEGDVYIDGNGGYAPTIQWTGILPPDPTYGIRVTGTTEKSGVWDDDDVTITWVDPES